MLNAATRSAMIEEALGRITPYVFLRLKADTPAESVRAFERAGLVASDAHGGFVLTASGRVAVWADGWSWDAQAREIDIPVGSLDEAPGPQTLSDEGYVTRMSVPVHLVGNRNVGILAAIGPRSIWRLSSLPGTPCRTLANAEKPFRISVDVLGSGDQAAVDVFQIDKTRC